MSKAKKKRTARPKTASKPIARGNAGTKRKVVTTKQNVNLVIRRTSGRIEKFEPNRMAQTVSRSGTPFTLAKDVARTVSDRITRESNKLAKEVESNRRAAGKRSSEPRKIEVEGTDVREMVAEELRQRNRPEIASSLVGERPENTLAEDKNTLGRARHPQSDSEAASRSKLLYDNSTPFAKSTRPSSMK